MKISIKVKHVLLFCTVFAFSYSCSLMEDEALLLTEGQKDIDGTWQIISVTRNGQNITEDFDFSRFRIKFSPDHTYTIRNHVPFIVKEGGTWSLDDPQYPFSIAFQQAGQEEALVTEFNYPIVEGARRLNLTFSPGCADNIYQYTMEKVSE